VTSSAPGQAPSELVCLTGMHRSGTSLLARVASLLGVDLGAPDALMGPGPDNPAGYWENRAVKELDDELLAHLGGAWDQPPLLESGWPLDPGLDPFRERALEILGRDLARPSSADGPTGCKEPRLCLLHPFWRTVVTISHTVVVVRHPVEVVASLRRRNGMEPGQGAILWLRYLLAVTAEPALLLRLDDLTDQPDETAARIAAHLGLPEPARDRLDEVRASHDPALLHRGAGALAPTDPAPSSPNLDLAMVVWNDGEIDVTALPDALRAALAQGWLGPPENRAALDAARAESVELREKLRKWHRRRKAQEAADPDAPLPPLPDVDGEDDEP